MTPTHTQLHAFQRRGASVVVVLALALTVAMGCEGNESESPPSNCGEAGCPEQTCDNFEPLRRPLFGDTHVHTSLSFDANVLATRVGPEGAYQHARGEPIGVPPYDADGNPLRTTQRDRPLDFAMVSDHAEYLGTVLQCRDPAQPAYDHPQCEIFRAGSDAAFFEFGFLVSAQPESVAYPELCGEDPTLCIEAGMDVWQRIIDAAEAANDASPSCEFTALIGYEWTATTGGNNLHRNVVFRNNTVPAQAISYFDAPYVEGLWEGLHADCLDAEGECDVLTIPHNSNLGADAYFRLSGRDGPFDAEYVAERAAMEPLIEIYQHKGDSECKPGETISDELCGFEKLPFRNNASMAVGTFSDPDPRAFVRSAFGEGMRLEETLGANPFKHGIVASTDTHISAPGAVRERDFPAHDQNASENPERELPPGLLDEPPRSPGGLAGVWAEENSREAIFLAMRRKETFGTSGPQIVVRFFGGWSYPDALCDDPDLAQVGYDRGVPMGGDLPEPPSGSAGPTFVVSAMQDPGTAEDPGTPLQRVQIVKGWLDGAGEYQVSVFDVAGNADNGATANLDTCEPDAGSGGFASLCETWTDPSFDPSQRGYYYARVVENPTCRWSQWQCNGAGVDCNVPATVTEGFEPCCDLTDAQCAAADVDCNAEPIAEGFESCCRPRVPKTIQERAWTSPIWYAPQQ